MWLRLIFFRNKQHLKIVIQFMENLTQRPIFSIEIDRFNEISLPFCQLLINESIEFFHFVNVLIKLNYFFYLIKKNQINKLNPQTTTTTTTNTFHICHSFLDKPQDAEEYLPWSVTCFWNFVKNVSWLFAYSKFVLFISKLRFVF